MGIDFAGYFIRKSIESTIIVSRDQLIFMIKKYSWLVYNYLPLSLKLDSEVNELIFLKDGLTIDHLKFLPLEMRSDKKFLLKLISKTFDAIGVVDDKLMDDDNFIKKLFFVKPDILPYVLEKFSTIYSLNKEEFKIWDTKYIIEMKNGDYENVNHSKKVFKILSDFKNGIVESKSIKKIGFEIPSAPCILIYDPNFNLEESDFINLQENKIIESDKTLQPITQIESLLHSPQLYKDNKELALFLIKHIGHSISVNNPIEFILNNLSSNLKDMKEIAIAVISNYYSLPFYPNFTDEKLTNLMNHFSDKIKNDEEVSLLAVSKDGLLLQYFSENIKNKINIVETAINQNPNAYLYASIEILNENKDLLIKVIKSKPDIILYISKKWYKDSDIKELVIKERETLSILFE